jgi:hypothetical protein
LERGTVATDWTPANSDIATAADLTSLTTRVTTAESKITDTAIVNTVTASSAYKNDLSFSTMSSTSKLFRNLCGFESNVSSLTGYIVIKTPITQSYMCKIQLSGYNYIAATSNFDASVSFYAYSTGTTFTKYSYTSLGNFEITGVKLARDASNKVVIILNTDTTAYSYPKIVVESALIGFNNPPATYKDGWSIEVTTDISAYTIKDTVTGMGVQQSISAQGTSLTALTTRVTTAESKITDSAIIDTVISSSDYAENVGNAIAQSAESVLSAAAAQYAHVSDVTLLNERVSSIQTQTESDIEYKFSQAKTYAIDVTEGMRTYIDEIQSYQRFSVDGLELGILGSPFITKLGNAKLSFLQNGTEIAYISNNKLYITAAEVTDRLSIGTAANGYLDMVTTPQGVGFKWRTV